MARRKPNADAPLDPVIRVRRIHRRDLNRVWEFLKRVFRAVNRETVEYQRPRTKTRFLEIYEEEGIEQLLFEVHDGDAPSIVGYAECAYEVIGSDNWINERYFENRDMRPLFVEEIAIHPDYQGRGIGSFVIEQLEHLARVRGCTHLVLEVAANNKRALQFYRARSFNQIDAAIFLAKKVISEPELLPPRALRSPGDKALPEAPGPEEPASQDIPEAPPAAAPETAAPDLPEAPRRRRTSRKKATPPAEDPVPRRPEKKAAPSAEAAPKRARKKSAPAQPARKKSTRPGRAAPGRVESKAAPARAAASKRTAKKATGSRGRT